MGWSGYWRQRRGAGRSGNARSGQVKFRALNPVQQRVALFRAIYDADYTCKKSSRSSKSRVTRASRYGL